MTTVRPLWRPLASPEDAAFYDGPDPRTQHIKAGWRKAPELASFQVDTIWDKDVSVAMHDGIRIRTDIFRPAHSETAKVPALVAWSPYGKSGRGKAFG
jgi:predicted acyl esterase